MKNYWLIKLPTSGRYIKDAPPTGFTSRQGPQRATRFASEDAARAFAKERGIFKFDLVEVTTTRAVCNGVKTTVTFES